MRDINWSASEKKIARRVYDAALEREYTALIRTLKDLAAKSESREDIWAIRDYLNEQEKLIDRKYDYRYSQLIGVFGRLLNEKWITEEDVAGLDEEKLELIRHIASG